MSEASGNSSSMRNPIPRLYLGTMTFGWSQTSSKVDERVALEMIHKFVAHNEKYSATSTSESEKQVMNHLIDTARIYAGGKTESIIGTILPQVRGVGNICPAQLVIGTKAHPSQPNGLSKAGIQAQLQASQDAMKLPSSAVILDEYYLHQPDTEHSLSESLEYLHELVTQGVIRRIGMSNYHASEVERAFQLCEQNHWTPPSVYQGLYNPLNRVVESELLPVLRQNNCSFVAYNPLAAGLLAGKHVDLETVQKGRFKNNPNYLPRFYTSSNFEALQLIRQECEKEEISMVEATYRWLLCHSQLDSSKGDGVLLGASSLLQLDQNLESCAAAQEKGPLPENFLQAFEEAWKLTKDSAFPYWRSYSSDMPNREALDQGASYNAAKK